MKFLTKYKYIIFNFAKGMLWLILLIGLFLIIKKVFKIDYNQWLQPFYKFPVIIYLLFFLSEFIFGILPPELFMLWALHYGKPGIYIAIIVFLTCITYSAGIAGYFFGNYMNNSRIYKYIHRKFIFKYENQFYIIGPFLIIIVALTPIPYSAVCMLVGATKYPFRKFLLYTISRIIRFGLYAWIIWEANII